MKPHLPLGAFQIQNLKVLYCWCMPTLQWCYNSRILRMNSSAMLLCAAATALPQQQVSKYELWMSHSVVTLHVSYWILNITAAAEQPLVLCCSCSQQWSWALLSCVSKYVVLSTRAELSLPKQLSAAAAVACAALIWMIFSKSFT